MTHGPGTTSVHEGSEPDPATGAVTRPLLRTSTFRFDTVPDLLAGARGERPGFYTRYGHPNFEAVEAKFAALHGAGAAVLFASGMAAFGGILQAHVRAGDRIVALADLYGGTRVLLAELAARFGVGVTLVPRHDDDALTRALPGARLLIAESPINPTLRIVDVGRLAERAHRAGALLAFDNTFATPVHQQPLAMGADLVWESATKALGGHSDLLAGVVAGRADLVEPVREARKVWGAIADPDTAWLLERGMKTLVARLDRQSRTAAELAAWLERHPAVASVLYPGLPSHPDHELARRQMRGYGFMVAFDCRGGLEAARAVAERVRLIAHAPSLGGVESLLSLPVYTSHAYLTAAERAACGVGDGLVRLSVGCEDLGDLQADLEAALGAPR